MGFEFPAARPVPEGYGTVTPWIIARDSAALIDFLKGAFDAEELARVVMPGGSIGHAEVRIGDSVVMMFDSRPEWPETPAFLRLYVPDCDATFRQAVAAGATPVTEVTYLSFGDRVGRVRDPFGNLWWLQTRVEDLPVEELARRAELPEFVKAMEYVAGAEVVEAR
ncbi:VOC family protein [Saccharopolyspora sp. NPDC050389]|uniref:VOC family protein n=1 Tax=Saccharopolyspora sp. NPDC050389 TaxID=3155516 RepID=UPI0033ED1D4E